MGRLTGGASTFAPVTSPAYQIKVAGRGAWEVLTSRVIAVSVAQHSGMQSDQLSMTLDDRPQLAGQKNLAVPDTGQELEVLMGHTTRLVSLGTFHVDQVTLNGSRAGRTMTITGVPRLMLNESTRTWAGMTLRQVVDEVAEQNGRLKTVVNPAMGQINIEDNQVRESDLSFLTRLATRHDGMVKPMAGRLLFLTGRLLFLKRGEVETAGGTALSTVSLAPQQIMQWSLRRTDRSAYDAAVAIWHDLEDAVQKQETASGPAGSTTVFRLRRLYRNKDDARAAAEAKLKELNRDTSSLTLTTLGNPELMAEGKIRVKDLRNEIDGDWFVKSVTHTFDSSGYACQLSAYREP